MKRAGEGARGRGRRALQGLAVAIAIVGASSASNATNYSEAVSGDLSNDNAMPTPIGALTLGSNIISGSSIPTGPVVDPMTGARADQDNDYVSFEVQDGTELSKLVLDDGSSVVSGDRFFLGIAQGSGVYVNPNFTSAKGLLGWTLVGPSQIGSDLLPDLGRSMPVDFPAIPGATTFTGPLGAGTYTLWILDGDNPINYSLDLQVAAVPEPAAWAMMIGGVGLVGGSMRRRNHARRLAGA